MSAKSVVIGARDRATGRISAQVLRNSDRVTMRTFVTQHVTAGATICTDANAGYQGISGYRHEVVNHEPGEYAKGLATTNGVESFWAMFKRGLVGTYHQVSRKHLDSYVGAFAGHHNMRSLDTVDQMAILASGMAGKRPSYRQLTT